MIPLSELNKHLFASLMPATHGEKPQEQPQAEQRPRRKAKAEAAPEAPAEPAE